MKIFRVEDKTGNGPYEENGPLRQFMHDKESPVRRTDRHPSPFGEGDDPRNGLLMLDNPRLYIEGYKQVMVIRDRAKLLSSNVPWDEANSPAIESTIDKPKRKRAKVKSLAQEEQATN